MTLLDRFHNFVEDTFHVSPKVADPVLVALIAALVSFIVSGDFNASELRLAAAGVVWGLVGFAAPPAGFMTQAEVIESARRRRR